MVSFPSQLLALRTGSEYKQSREQEGKKRPAGVGGGCGVAKL